MRMSKVDLEDDHIDIDDIKRNGDDTRKLILELTKTHGKATSPNTFNYRLNDKCIGLNEISTVDMGYAGTRVDGEHLGKRQPYLGELEDHVHLMEESNNAILVLNGGLFTYVPKVRNGELLSYKSQIAYFYSLLKDLAKQGKIVAMVRGTEEHRILKNQGVDVYGILDEALGLKGKVCNDALINVGIKDDLVGDANVGIRTINWNNSATTTAYIGRKMEERATKRGGADVFLARTTKNFFKTAVVGESHDGKVEKKPIYMVSAGPYTPFKGAMTAGAEYNSIKDGELAPNSSWYRITVEPSQDAMTNRPYIVRVSPIQYAAHHITEHSTDKTLAAIMNSVEYFTEGQLEYLFEEYSRVMPGVREQGSALIRQILKRNKEIAAENDRIRAYREDKGIIVPQTEEQTIEDLGTNLDND